MLRELTNSLITASSAAERRHHLVSPSRLAAINSIHLEGKETFSSSDHDVDGMCSRSAAQRVLASNTAERAAPEENAKKALSQSRNVRKADSSRICLTRVGCAEQKSPPHKVESCFGVNLGCSEPTVVS